MQIMRNNFSNFFRFDINFLTISVNVSFSQDNQIYKFNDLKVNKLPIIQAFNDPYWNKDFSGIDNDVFSCVTLDNKNDIVAVGATAISYLPTNSPVFKKTIDED